MNELQGTVEEYGDSREGRVCVSQCWGGTLGSWLLARGARLLKPVHGPNHDG